MSLNPRQCIFEVKEHRLNPGFARFIYKCVVIDERHEALSETCVIHIVSCLGCRLIPEIIFYKFEDRRKHAINIAAGEPTSASFRDQCPNHLEDGSPIFLTASIFKFAQNYKRANIAI